MHAQKEIRSKIQKIIDDENRASIADAEKKDSIPEIKGVFFIDNPIFLGDVKPASRWEKFKSLFKR